jgi:oligopeptide/dipeptide ABC transporter ATP-binding protein
VRAHEGRGVDNLHNREWFGQQVTTREVRSKKDSPQKDFVLEVENLRVALGSGETEKVGVADVSFTIERGETVALVGESGCGKTLTALAILGLAPPGFHVSARILRFVSSEIGAVDILTLSERRLRDIRGRRIAMIFQNPTSALNPVMTIGHQIVGVVRRHTDMSVRDARNRAKELLDLVEVSDAGRRLGEYPHQLSGGVQQRTMIAMALAGAPELLIADEPTTALDATVQAQIIELLERIQGELSMSVLLISHDLGVVAQMADRVNVLYAGMVVECANVRLLYHDATHPYTVGLLRIASLPTIGRSKKLEPIPGAPPEFGLRVPGCPFAPRCPSAFDTCLEELPQLNGLVSHQVACHLVNRK